MASKEQTQQRKTNINTTKNRSLIAEFLLGGVSTSTACIFSNPFEVIKTRLQVQGEQGAAVRAFRNSFHAFYTICRNEGFAGIQAGLTPAIGYQLCMNGTRLGSYGPIKRLIGAEPDRPFYLLRTVAAGAVSGCLSAFVGSPFFLVKVRLQTQATSNTLAMGTQHGYRDLSFSQVIRKIIADEGLKGMYRGVTSGMLRVSTGSAAQLSTYDMLQRELNAFSYLQQHKFVARCVSAFVSGFVVVTAMNPFDVIATRMYNQRVGERYTSNLNCFVQIVTKEGPLGLLKGWSAHWMRLGPHTFLTFVFWEQAKTIASAYGF